MSALLYENARLDQPAFAKMPRATLIRLPAAPAAASLHATWGPKHKQNKVRLHITVQVNTLCRPALHIIREQLLISCFL